MSLLSKAGKFARSPQGRRFTEKAMRSAKDPATRRKLEGLRSRFAKKR